MRQPGRLSLVLLVAAAASLCAVVLHADDAEPGSIGAGQPLRQWSDTTGRFQIDAKLVDYVDGTVKLRRFDGKLLSVSLSRLSKSDREYVRAALSKAKPDEDSDATPSTPKPSAAELLDADIPSVKPTAKPVDDATSTDSKSTPAKPSGSGHAGPPNPNCPVCRGIGLVPLERFAAYAHIEGQPKPKATESVCGQYCPKCQDGKDPAALLEIETMRLATAPERHEEWERRLQMKLTRIETHSLVIHAEVTLPEARRVALALEALTHHLQQLTGDLALTPRRPATDDLFLFIGKPGHKRLLEVLKEEERYSHIVWDLFERLSGGTIDHISFVHRSSTGTPLENTAIHTSAYRQIQVASGSKGRAWLYNGFASYCEFAILRQNLIHAIDPQSTTVRLGQNWDTVLRQLARMGMLRSWEEMFKQDLAVFEPIHYLEAKSMVQFLLAEPDKFLDYLDRVAGGADDATALEGAYGKTAKELEADWRRWLGVR
ncbi:MAG: SHD1 domain-containing protein [Pirellulaceae bacterium]